MSGCSVCGKAMCVFTPHSPCRSGMLRLAAYAWWMLPPYAVRQSQERLEKTLDITRGHFGNHWPGCEGPPPHAKYSIKRVLNNQSKWSLYIQAKVMITPKPLIHVLRAEVLRTMESSQGSGFKCWLLHWPVLQSIQDTEASKPPLAQL